MSQVVNCENAEARYERTSYLVAEDYTMSEALEERIHPRS